jgi:hypothetical protein
MGSLVRFEYKIFPSTLKKHSSLLTTTLAEVVGLVPEDNPTFFNQNIFHTLSNTLAY